MCCELNEEEEEEEMYYIVIIMFGLVGGYWDWCLFVCLFVCTS